MSDELSQKLIKKVNFDFFSQLDEKKIRGLSFLPINILKDTMYVAITQTSNKVEIANYIQSALGKKTDFIFLRENDYRDFVIVYQEAYFAKTGLKPLTDDAKLDANKEQNEDDNLIDLDMGASSDLDLSQYEIKNTPPIKEEVSQAREESSQTFNEANFEPEEIKMKGPEEESLSEMTQSPTTSRNSRGDRKKHIGDVQNPAGKKLGEILIEEGLITDKQLTIALAEAKATDVPLGSILVKLNYITIQDLKDALSAQQGIEMASEEQLKPQMKVAQILPENFIKANKVVPISVTDKKLVVGMVNPGDTTVINEIVYITGLKPTVMMITHFEFERFLEQYYHERKEGTDSIISEINRDGEIEKSESLWEQVDKEIQDASGVVSKFANKIITNGIDQHASDIHIEPRFDGYVVRYRCDGILQEVLKIPESVDNALISRFKVMARLNIAEHRRPQDGNFAIKYNNQTYDFRINTLPVAGKEKMVIRILAPASSLAANKKSEIKIVGLLPEQLELLKKLTTAPNGIILTSGPTGSGKTTTLYSIIKALNDVKVNITTIEDPVEIRMEGINQSAINAKAGITFANSMRAILRQDPDIILIGEIRDYETLEVAISAALTGHLVLSTIHTNSAAATVTRLIEMGAKDYLVSSTLTGVLAQRLVRKLCPHCRQAYNPTLEEAQKIILDKEKAKEFTKNLIYRAVGCSKCNNMGYTGRLGVYEIMGINKDLRKLIAQKAHDIEIEEFAIEHNNMITLQQSCIEHIKAGLTTIDEFVRVLGLATD